MSAFESRPRHWRNRGNVALYSVVFDTLIGLDRIHYDSSLDTPIIAVISLD